MENLDKQKNNIAVLLIREKKDGTTRQDHIKTPVLILSTIFILFTVIALCTVLLTVYTTNRFYTAAEYEETVDELSTEINDLHRENYDLRNKLSILSETVATKVALEEVKNEEIFDISLPKGFPLGGSGAATFLEEEEDEFTLIINASEGNTIITAGAGIVESIEPDERYGTRIIIDHQNGYKSVYLNSGQPLVRQGEELGRRYILFLVGNNNNVLGYQVLEEDKQIHPLDVMEISG